MNRATRFDGDDDTIDASYSVSESFQRMGGARNPFSMETIRAQQPVTFPDPPAHTLTWEERRIVANARRDAVAMGYSMKKGQLGAQAVAQIERSVNAYFNTTSLQMNHQMESALREIVSPEIKDILIVFTVQGMVRMGAAMTDVANAAEEAIRDLAKKNLITGEQASLLERLFGGG